MQSLKIHYYSDLNLLDITAFVIIGGALSTHLRGPIPASLLPGGPGVVGMNGGPPAPPGPNFRLPKHTKMSINSGDRNNWRT